MKIVNFKKLFLISCAVLGINGISIPLHADPGDKSGVEFLIKSAPVFNFGNNGAGAKLDVIGQSLTLYQGHNSTITDLSRSSGIRLTAAFLNKLQTIIDIYSHGEYERAPDLSFWDLEGYIKVLGVTVASPSFTKTATAHIGDTGTKTWSLTFYEASASYPVGPFTLTVKGSVKGSVNGRSYVSQLIENTSTYFHHPGQAYTYGAGIVTATGRVSAGIPFLFEGNFEVTTDLVNAWVTSQSWNQYQYFYNAPKNTNVWIAGSVDGDAGATIGAGHARVWLETAGQEYARNTFASWNGISLGNKNLFDQRWSEYFAE